MNVNQIQAMKGTGKKSAALVVWDAPTAHIAHECGADFLIVGDSVGVFGVTRIIWRSRWTTSWSP